MNANLGQTERVLHGSFTVERELPASPGDVFAAYAELPVRRRWFRMPGRPDGEHELDFRVGGTERLAATFAPYGDGRAEQYAFLVITGNGDNDVAHLKGSTRLQLNGLHAALSA